MPKTVDEIKAELFLPGCREISGFGGGYEDTCRNMVAAGVKWCLDNPKYHNFKIEAFKGVFGLCNVKGEGADEFDEVLMVASNRDCTGAMHQASIHHIFWIMTHSIEEYAKEMMERAEDG